MFSTTIQRSGSLTAGPEQCCASAAKAVRSSSNSSSSSTCHTQAWASPAGGVSSGRLVQCCGCAVAAAGEAALSMAGRARPGLTMRSMVLLQGTRKGGRISVVSRQSPVISRPACIQPSCTGKGSLLCHKLSIAAPDVTLPQQSCLQTPDTSAAAGRPALPPTRLSAAADWGLRRLLQPLQPGRPHGEAHAVQG